MLGLLLSTIIASAVDSLNPIAITQQFVLQGMVKKPRDILYFIIPTGLTNLAGGFVAYLGLVSFIADLLKKLMAKYGPFLFSLELILGIALLIAGSCFIQNNKIEALKKQVRSLHGGGKNASDEAAAAQKIKSVSPGALVALGIGATISELTSAFPYFAFLGAVFNYGPSLLQTAFILIVYNIIYTLPLLILYFIYLHARDKFDRLYTVIKAEMTKWANVLAPVLFGVIGCLLILHPVSQLFK
ncbi:MAG: GAP family protein [Peptococcaceae bacterium]|nr:GAP family protein [Peptococcaceae bacterium]